MSGNSEEIGEPPAYITCEPLSRIFPAGWKDIFFRRLGKRGDNGLISYTCPVCHRKFDHSLIDHLQGDHIWPYSLFGESSWDNYQLICGDCNAAKNNRLNMEVRKVLGAGEFRDIVAAFLRKQIEVGALSEDAVLNSFLLHKVR
jgi:HNH endonuclease